MTEEEKKESNRNTKTPENLSLIHNNSKNQEQGLDKNVEEKKPLEEKNLKTDENKLEESIGNDITRPESKILNRFKELPSSKEKEFLQYYNK